MVDDASRLAKLLFAAKTRHAKTNAGSLAMTRGLSVAGGRFVVHTPASKRQKKDEKAMPTAEEMQQELERLRRENEALKKTSSRGLSLKVSEKGALSVYGLGRFPVTLYKEQWGKLIDAADDIRAFIQANDAALKTKAAKENAE